MEEDIIKKHLEQNKTKHQNKINRVHNYKSVYLIIGLKSDIIRCRFDKDVLVRKAKKAELERFQNHIKYNLSDYKFVVACDYQSTASDAHQSIYHFSARINFLFKLLSGGKICLPNCINYIEDSKSGNYASIGLYTDNKIREFASGSILMDKTQIGHAKNIWKKFTHADNDKNKAFHIAWTRYLFTHRKYDFEDKLIDCMIAFEALFLKTAENEGAAYKLALRVTYFLREDFNKNELFEFMKKSYSLRSKVVHGSNTKENVIKFKDKTLEIKRVNENLLLILESVFQRYILDFYNLSINDLIDQIDIRILNSFDKK